METLKRTKPRQRSIGKIRIGSKYNDYITRLLANAKWKSLYQIDGYFVAANEFVIDMLNRPFVYCDVEYVLKEKQGMYRLKVKGTFHNKQNLKTYLIR